MADYWKSVPKKLCSICNVWMYDNRPSVERHERSKQHLEKLEKKMERAMRPKRNDEKIEKVVDQIDPLAHVTNSAFVIDGLAVTSNESIGIKPAKKLKINFGNNSQKTSNKLTSNEHSFTREIIKINEPEVVDVHPILGGWETVRIIERAPIIETKPEENDCESLINETTKDDNIEDSISEFQNRINQSAATNILTGEVEKFKKSNRKRPAALRKPFGE